MGVRDMRDSSAGLKFVGTVGRRGGTELYRGVTDTRDMRRMKDMREYHATIISWIIVVTISY